MTGLPSIFDALLALCLVLLAWYSLKARELFHGVVLFVMFGVFVSVAWLRLHAPDIALAEVAIGAGLTGALFLGTLGRMEASHRRGAQGPRGHNAVITGMVAVAAVALCALAMSLARGGPNLGEQVMAQLTESGVKNPVTAVVLNFRGADTLFEIGVLFLALLGAHGVHRTYSRDAQALRLPTDSLLTIFVRLAGPMLVLTAAYLVWIGDRAPGGAFQGGAILGGLGVMILLAGFEVPLGLDRLRLRLAGSMGFVVFLVIGVLCTGRGTFLEYPRDYAKPLMLAIELVGAASIGFILASLFAVCASLLHPSPDPGGGHD